MTKPALETASNPPAHRVGLALGSGSAPGLAHIGVLRAIEEAGIEIDVIAGTGMGALIGAIFAAGKPADKPRPGPVRSLAASGTSAGGSSICC